MQDYEQIINRDLIIDAGESSEESTFIIMNRKDKQVTMNIQQYMEEMQKKSFIFKEILSKQT
jgi:hypothetical protein